MTQSQLPAGRTALLATVFLTGAAVLVIEIAAARVLSPYFGSTLFTFSSVISTILAALSCGYYLGGRLCDRWPSPFLFYAVIAIGGVAVALQHVLTVAVLPGIAYRLSLVEGPLVSSVVLFLLPALVLGTLSPFAIKLLQQRQPGRGIGEVSGLVFFWSTLGSIAGSLAAGFWLIPSFGTGSIVLGTSAGLLALGSAGMVADGRRPALALAVAAGGAGLCAVAAAWPAKAHEAGVLHSQPGLYEQITVQERRIGDRTVRLLLQDANPNSGMYVDDGSLAFGYTRYFELHRLFVPDVRRALAIGGGAYSVPKALLEQTQAVVDVAEVEPALLPLARRHFGLPDSPRLRNHVMDGRRFLHESAGGYDLIFSDVYASFATVPPQFATREFFELARSRLSGRGVFIANHAGSLAPRTAPMLLSLYKTMRQVFPHVHLLATVSPQSQELQNFIFIGQNSPEPVDLRHAEGLAFKQPGLAAVAGHAYRPDPSLLAAVPAYTDDHAPVEHYAAELVRLYAAQRAR